MSDPTWENVVLRLTCDGTDGSTTFTDVSPAAHTVTVHGTAQVDTAQSKWGGASLYLDGSSKLTVAASAQFTFGTDPWTIAMWVRPSAVADIFVWDLRRTSPGMEVTAGLIGTFGTLDYYDDDALGILFGSVSLTTGTWQHVEWAYDGTTMRVFVDGVVSLAEAHSLNHLGSRTLTIGDQYASDLTGDPFTGWIDDIIIVKGEALHTAAFTPPTAAYPTSGSVAGQDAFLELGGILDATAEFEAVAEVQPVAILSDSGPLGQPSSLARVDFTGAVDPDAPVRYVVDLHAEDGDVRAPISSWQATQQVDQSCYLQCVIPACDPYVDAIADATSFTVSRTGQLRDGSPVEYPMATSDINDATFTRSPSRNTATLSGYSDAFEAVEDPPPLYDRTLRDIRLITSSSGGTRVRCAIDWLLRPAQRAIVNGDELVVAYINWYANNDDEFMDVGSRTDTGG